MVPRPKHLPVDIWMPIASGKTIDMMARYGLKAMVTLNGEKILDDVVRAYHAACERHGRKKQLGEDMIWGAGVYLADSQEEAIRRLEPAHDERFKWFAPFGFVRYADEQGRTWGSPGAPARTPSLKDGVAQKAWFCGPPAQVIDGIKSIAAKYPGLENFMIHWAEGLAAQGIQGAAALVRQGRDAGVQARVSRRTQFDLPEPRTPRTMKENVKRVFYVRHLAHPCYLDIIAQRPEIRLDKLENESADEVAQPIMAAAHAYQIGSARDELDAAVPRPARARSRACRTCWSSPPTAPASTPSTSRTAPKRACSWSTSPAATPKRWRRTCLP